jgi:predicted RNA-binding Zn ribbon-like protein
MFAGHATTKLCDMTTLPSWYPAAETKPAPMPLLLVQAFLNTRDFEDDSDMLEETAQARTWLVDTELLDVSAALTTEDLDVARSVRDSIRSLLSSRSRDEGSAPQLRPLREFADAHRPRLTVDDRGRLTLDNPQRDDLGDGLFDLLLIIRDAQEQGSWSRLKACANADCRWVFYDRSRNQQGHWCDMAVCGNRLKNRALRARRR